VEVPVSGRDVVLIGGTVSDADTLELFDLACSIVKCGARSLALLIPYFGYSTMERAVKAGEVVTAKTRARLFSAIPMASAGNRVLLVDLHSEGIPHYFEGGIRPVHVYAKSVVVELARRFGGEDMVLACTDAGRAKWVESLANEMGVPASFVFKRRLDGSHTEVTAMSAAVSGKSVVIYDDMIRTGGSLISAARAYKAAGATRLTAIATHGVFPGDALERLSKTGLFSAIACTDTHPRARELAGASLHVASIAGVLASAIKELP
jgi:ribose-phosphate pyrophosphokinase